MTRIEEIKIRLREIHPPGVIAVHWYRADVDYLLAEVKRMREALNQIDAIVPSISHLPACSAPALRGILERIGFLLIAALKGTQS